MGIGISYTGHDGKARHFDDPEKARAFLDSMGAAAKRHTGEALREAASRIPSPLRGQDGRAKVMPGGSVVDSRDGLCLRGEEQSPLVEGVRVFASVNGSKGFKRMDEIDPPGSAPVCGPTFGCDSADEDSAEAKPGEAARIPFVSRTKMEKDEATGMVVLYEFIREMAFSPSGRMVGCTKERRRVVGSFLPGTAGEGNGKYGVMLFYDAFPDDPQHPTPLAMAFGSEIDLDTYDKETDTFGCNADKDDPPVKIIGITEEKVE